jgi:glycosyltransferase involved in cell wall biosynthesis
MIIFSNEYLANFSNKKLATGGPARFAKEFSDFAVKKGHEWDGLFMMAKKGIKFRLSKKKIGQKIYWQIVNDGKMYVKITKAKKKIDVMRELRPLINKVGELIKKSSADIVFLNGFSVSNWIIMQAAHSVNKKIVIQHAGIWTKEVNMYKHFFSSWGRKLVLQMEKDISDCVDCQIFLNDFSRKVYNKIVNKVPVAKSRIIPLPFMGRQHAQLKIKKINSAQPIKIGIVARWDRIKNQQAVLDLAKEIRRQNLNWQIYSVTVIPETKKFLTFKKQYRQLIKVIPPMKYTELPKFYRKMDLMILPSHFDVSPNVVLEAAREGIVTIISPNVGWVTEYKRNGFADLIVDFSKPNLVVKKINRIIGGRPTSKLLNSLLKKHEKNKIFKEYLRLFGELIAIND